MLNLCSVDLNQLLTWTVDVLWFINGFCSMCSCCALFYLEF